MKYFHRYHGAKFFMPNGKEISFAGGEFDSAALKDADRKMVEEELDKVANVPSSMIYTKEAVADSSEGAVHREILKDAELSFDQHNKIAPGATTTALPQAAESRPILNSAATKAVGGATTGTGDDLASKLEKARNQVAAAGTANTSTHAHTAPASEGKKV